MKKLLLMFVMTLVGLVAFAQDPIVSITTVVANQKSGVSSYTASWILGAPESSETGLLRISTTTTAMNLGTA